MYDGALRFRVVTFGRFRAGEAEDRTISLGFLLELELRAWAKPAVRGRETLMLCFTVTALSLMSSGLGLVLKANLRLQR